VLLPRLGFGLGLRPAQLSRAETAPPLPAVPGAGRGAARQARAHAAQKLGPRAVKAAGRAAARAAAAAAALTAAAQRAVGPCVAGCVLSEGMVARGQLLLGPGFGVAAGLRAAASTSAYPATAVMPTLCAGAPLTGEGGGPCKVRRGRGGAGRLRGVGGVERRAVWRAESAGRQGPLCPGGLCRRRWR
jgi:hypothetical protein